MVNSTFLPKSWTEIKAYYSFKIFLRLNVSMFKCLNVFCISNSKVFSSKHGRLLVIGTVFYLCPQALMREGEGGVAD